MKVVGIDLAGKEENPTGFAVLEGRRINTRIVGSDERIRALCEDLKPKLVAVDAPLGFPSEGNLRKADSELISRGYRVLPPTLGGMSDLTARGGELSRRLEEDRLKVIEVHPITSARILFGSKEIGVFLDRLREKGWGINAGDDEHERDSVAAAYTGYLHEKGRTEEVGEEGDSIVIPRPR